MTRPGSPWRWWSNMAAAARPRPRPLRATSPCRRFTAKTRRWPPIPPRIAPASRPSRKSCAAPAPIPPATGATAHELSRIHRQDDAHGPAQDPLSQLAPGDPSDRRGGCRLPDALLGGRRLFSPLARAADETLRARPFGDAGRGDGADLVLAQHGRAGLWRVAAAADRGRVLRHRRHGRAALDRSGLHAAATLRADEDHARNDAGHLLRLAADEPRVAPLVGAGAGGADPPAGGAGVAPARSGNLDPAARGRRHVDVRGGCPLGVFRRRGGAGDLADRRRIPKPWHRLADAGRLPVSS